MLSGTSLNVFGRAIETYIYILGVQQPYIRVQGAGFIKTFHELVINGSLSLTTLSYFIPTIKYSDIPRKLE